MTFPWTERKYAFPKVKSLKELFNGIELWRTQNKRIYELPAKSGLFSDAELAQRKLKVSSYCFLQGKNTPSASFNVSPTHEVINFIENNMSTIDGDELYFEIVEWSPKEALVLVRHNAIIGSRYLAVVKDLRKYVCPMVAISL